MDARISMDAGIYFAQTPPVCDSNLVPVEQQTLWFIFIGKSQSEQSI